IELGWAVSSERPTVGLIVPPQRCPRPFAGRLGRDVHRDECKVISRFDVSAERDERSRPREGVGPDSLGHVLIDSNVVEGIETDAACGWERTPGEIDRSRARCLRARSLLNGDDALPRSVVVATFAWSIELWIPHRKRGGAVSRNWPPSCQEHDG